MGAILQSLGKTVVASLVLLILLILVIAWLGGLAQFGSMPWLQFFFFRWLHVLSGVMWIGLLWYFNFVQMPSMPKIPDDQKPAVSKVIAPAALFWFRWAALSTVVTGLMVAGMNTLPALSFQKGFVAIGIGMWLALIMAFNVWFIIWPNQKRALGIVQVDADTKAKSARTAMLTSRLNTLFSVPMLYMMVAQSHGGL